jgi:hypothetical protein
VIDFVGRGWRDRSGRHLRAAAADDLIAIELNEFKQHGTSAATTVLISAAVSCLVWDTPQNVQLGVTASALHRLGT